LDREDKKLALTSDAHILVVAGTDSSGGAGIVRDVETICAIGLRTCLAVTAVTVQTHEVVIEIHPVEAELVAHQMRAALKANNVAAVKIGMLGTAQTAMAVASVLRENPQVPAILDPVLASSSGQALLEAGAIGIIKYELMPLCSLVTPNLIELAMLSNSQPAAGEEGALQQGQDVLAAGLQAVLVKGGHASGTRSTDILLRPHQEPLRFDAPRLAGSLRGTGCMLSSATAANMALGEPLEKSVEEAKRYVSSCFNRL
jgi:hydroxymethylpyrimidine/phosphomethylpyrimidine kinase